MMLLPKEEVCDDYILLKKRLQYVGIIRAILYHRIGVEQTVSLFSEVLKAQQARVDKGYMEPLERNWKACLAFAYHTQEEAWEVVRELPRRQWKEQKVNPRRYCLRSLIHKFNCSRLWRTPVLTSRA